GNIAGVLCFFVLYTYLPSAIYAYIGVIGGIGIGFSAKYGWQAVFNTFGALAIASQLYGVPTAMGLRVFQNVFGVLFALGFCLIFHWVMQRRENTQVTAS
ncbi:MAG: FUSC family protein, partial [Butyricicoccus porcorum]|nr:FUSC family protein [Butyricicoccus porcorum]